MGVGEDVSVFLRNLTERHKEISLPLRLCWLMEINVEPLGLTPLLACPAQTGLLAISQTPGRDLQNLWRK